MIERNTKYKQVYETLKGGILSGRYNADKPLPSLRALVRKYGVSMITIRRAFDELERERLVFRCKGSGTFVTKQGASRKIGVLVPETACSEFFSKIVREISLLAQKEGYALLFVEIDTSDSKERARQTERIAYDFIEQGVAGVIFSPVEYVKDSEKINMRILKALDRASVSVVLCDFDVVPFPERSNYDVVSVNNYEAGAKLFEHLYAQGARKIHFLTLPHVANSHLNRMRGVISACVLKGCKWSEKNVLFANPSDVNVVRRHLRKECPDAFICGNDNLAAMLRQTFDKIGIRVPGDVMLTGFNDVSIAKLTLPPITTIHQPCKQIAESAFRRLLRRIATPTLPPNEIYLPASLVVRESTMKHQ